MLRVGFYPVFTLVCGMGSRRDVLAEAVERLGRLEEELDEVVGYAEELRRRLMELAESEAAKIGEEVVNMVRSRVEEELRRAEEEAREEAERLLRRAEEEAAEKRKRMMEVKEKAVALVLDLILGRR